MSPVRGYRPRSPWLILTLMESANKGHHRSSSERKSAYFKCPSSYLPHNWCVQIHDCDKKNYVQPRHPFFHSKGIKQNNQTFNKIDEMLQLLNLICFFFVFFIVLCIITYKHVSLQKTILNWLHFIKHFLIIYTMQYGINKINCVKFTNNKLTNSMYSW